MGIEIWIKLSLPFAHVNEKPAYFKKDDVIIVFKDPRLSVVRISNKHGDFFVCVAHAPHTAAPEIQRTAFGLCSARLLKVSFPLCSSLMLMPALVTPFKDGAVDVDTLKSLVDWHIEQGSHGLVPVGTTGESPTLSHEEHEMVVAEVVKAAAGRVPIIAGAGSNNTAESLRFMA